MLIFVLYRKWTRGGIEQIYHERRFYIASGP